MQIMNAISSNLFDSYQLNKKEASEKAQIVSRFMDTESQKVVEAELATRPKIEELQSHVEQMKKEYLEGRKEVCDWANDSLELRLNRNSLSLEEVEENYPMYAQVLYAIHEDKNMDNHGWDYVSAEHSHYQNYYENRTHQYTKNDFRNAINNIEKAVTQILEQEFEKDPTSHYTNMLILFKAQIQAIPEVWEQEKQQVLQLANQDESNKRTFIEEYSAATRGELERLSRIAARIGNVHPELKEQLNDSVRILYDYYHSSVNDTFNLVSPEEWSEALEDFVSNLSSHLSLVDNTETLFNLAADSSSLQTNTKESKSHENLIDRIRSKLKGADDSILQQAMNHKISATKVAPPTSL